VGFPFGYEVEEFFHDGFSANVSTNISTDKPVPKTFAAALAINTLAAAYVKNDVVLIRVSNPLLMRSSAYSNPKVFVRTNFWKPCFWMARYRHLN
jgi:hypothetical protein